MSDSLIIQILLGVLALMIGVGSFVASSRAAKVQAVTVKSGVEAEAYNRATAIYEGAIHSMEAQIGRFREEVALLNTEVEKLRASNLRLSTEVTELQATNLELLAEMRNR